MKLNFQDFTPRLQGIVSEKFHGQTILTVGAGAGSYSIEKVARCAPKMLKNCDFDRVEVPNLCRTTYAVDDVGAFKVDALEKRIRSINPFVLVQSYPRNILDMSRQEHDELFADVDLVVAGTDQDAAQGLINELAVTKGIPAVFVGVHANAEGGRIIWYAPGMACYRCVTKEHLDATETNIVGGAGCLIDVQFIDMIASKIVLALLERGQDSAMGRFAAGMGTRGEVVVRCHPASAWGNAVLDAVLGDLPTTPKDFAAELKRDAVFTMDSLWLDTQRDPGCAVCGTK